LQVWFLYIIENKYQHYYTGICKNLQKRLAEHQASGLKCAKALRGKGPLAMIYCCQLDSHSHALKMEVWLKKRTKAQKRLFIAGDLPCPHNHMTLAVNPL
jgi:putative endonuclease